MPDIIEASEGSSTEETHKETRSSAAMRSNAVKAAREAAKAATAEAPAVADAPGADAPAAEAEAEIPTGGDKLDIKARIKQREQEFREKFRVRIDAERAQLAQERQALAQERAQEKERQNYLEGLKRSDPRAYRQAMGLDDDFFSRAIRADLADKDPAAKLALEQDNYNRKVEAIEAKFNQMNERQQQEAAARQIQQNRETFVSQAQGNAKYPLVAQLASQNSHALLRQGKAMQDAFVEQFGRPPNYDEIMMNLESEFRLLNPNAATASKSNVEPLRKPPSPSSQTRTSEEKPQPKTEAERRKAAIFAARKAAGK